MEILNKEDYIKHVNMIPHARMLADFLHNGQKYGDEDYMVHLQSVYLVLVEYQCMVGHVLVGAWLHDIVEDTNASFELIRKHFGEDVEHVVYLVTNEIGKNRQEKTFKTVKKLAGNQDGIMLKLADRIANVRKSCGNEKFFKMYKDEYYLFRGALYDKTHSTTILNMWEELDKIFEFEG